MVWNRDPASDPISSPAAHHQPSQGSHLLTFTSQLTLPL